MGDLKTRSLTVAFLPGNLYSPSSLAAPTACRLFPFSITIRFEPIRAPLPVQ